MEDSNQINLVEQEESSIGEIEFSEKHMNVVAMLQVILAVLIPFIMIALTTGEELKKKFRDYMIETEDVRNSDVFQERKNSNVKAKEVQWLKLEKALKKIESKTRNEELHLDLFLDTNDEDDSVIKPNLKILFGAEITDNYFVISCQAAEKKLLYNKDVKRVPEALREDWLKAIGNEIKPLKIVEETVVFADWIDDPNLVLTENKEKLHGQIYSRLDSLYKDTCMLQGEVFSQLYEYYGDNLDEQSDESFEARKQLQKAERAEYDNLLVEQYISALDKQVESAFKGKGVYILPEVWKNSKREIKKE